jgi:outer membrane protein with beta-barrel domain
MRLISRSIAAAVLLVVVAAPALAEFPGRYGLRAGVNLSAFTGEFGDLIGPENRVAANVAFVYEYDFISWLALHTGLGYSGKGGVGHSEGTDPIGNPTGTSQDTWSFEYLEVPLLMRGRMAAFGTSHAFAEVGPMLDFRLSGKFETDAAGVDDVSLTSRMNAFDLGIGAGAGLEFPAGIGRLGLEARYTRGLDDLFDVSGTLSTINQAWTFAVSYTR